MEDRERTLYRLLMEPLEKKMRKLLSCSAEEKNFAGFGDAVFVSDKVPVSDCICCEWQAVDSQLRHWNNIIESWVTREST